MNTRNRIIVAAIVLAAVGIVLASKRAATPAQTGMTGQTRETPAISVGKIPGIICLGSGKCIPCREMEPVRKALKRDFPASLTVEFHDIFKEKDIAEKFDVRIIPTTIFYDAQGKELERFEGFISGEDILATFSRHGIQIQR